MTGPDQPGTTVPEQRPVPPLAVPVDGVAADTAPGRRSRSTPSRALRVLGPLDVKRDSQEVPAL